MRYLSDEQIEHLRETVVNLDQHTDLVEHVGRQVLVSFEIT